VDEKYWNSKEP